MRVLGLALAAACGGGAAHLGPAATLRPACGAGQYWDGHTCVKAGDAPAKLVESKQELDALKVDEAKASLDAAEHAGPLDHEHNVALWEQRGIAAAYVDDEAAASTAFDMLLALDPGHFLSYTLSPKATFVFEKVRQRKDRTAPELDVNWQRGGKVGEPVPLDVEVLADPKQFLKRATIFVRERGETGWHAADLALPKPHGEQHLVLPAIDAKKPVSLEVYLEAYDDKGNQVLAWADPTRPREIPLRYDPPRPWYVKWWGISLIGSAVALAAGVTVYELTLAPPDRINAGLTIK